MKEAVYNLPQEFLKKLQNLYPGQYPSIAHTFLQKKHPAFRVNYAKTDLVGLRRLIIEQHVRCRELTFPKGAFVLLMPLRDFQTKAIYTNGFVYVQNVSSMLPALALEPQNTDTILDLCAAPGAKTTQMYSLAPQAKLVACEKNRPRYYKLLANLKQQGAETAQVELIDSIWVRKKFPEYFTKILADVPCSAEGRFLVSDPKSFRYWKQQKVKEMEHKQKKLMHSAFYALQEGGTLVYSTCTFSPEENEEVVDWMLNKFKDQLQMQPLSLPFANAVPAFAKWGEKKYSQSVTLARRIIPNDTMEGFFIAKLKKIAA